MPAAPLPKLNSSGLILLFILQENNPIGYFLAGNSEATAFPIFKQHYDNLCEKVLKGEQLQIDSRKTIPEKISTPLSNKQRKEKMKALREELKL